MKNRLSIITLFIILISFGFLYKNTGNFTVVEEKKVNKPTQQFAEEPSQEEEKPEEVAKKKPTKADKIIAVAEQHKGAPYKAGGTTKNGFDCSGLVMTSFKKEGVQLPRASYQMATKGKEIELKDVKRGDLVFFKTNDNKPNKISHVGLVTSVDDGVVSFIHSTNQKGVIVSTTEEEYYKKSFCKAKRVL